MQPHDKTHARERSHPILPTSLLAGRSSRLRRPPPPPPSPSGGAPVIDAAMSRSGAMDLASGLGGKITKDEVKSAVDEYEKYHGYYGGKEEARKSNYTDMVNKYYNLATSFYEYGWGESFHFAHRWNGESLRESIKRHEHFLALQLGVKPGMKVLDVGCGIGGPLREIAKFSLASVTGLNNNEYQITRGKELNRVAGVSGTCDFVKVIWDKDLAEDSPVPWYLPLDPSRFSLSSFRLTTVGRAITRTMVKALEYVGLAPQGSERVSNFLEKAAEGLVEGGKDKARSLKETLWRSKKHLMKLRSLKSSYAYEEMLKCV
uniref:SAM-dependent methyltransferase Erg6/SMT-type domain-containing protein n=1 Tax=Oryza nivara TaxID=4536 RepID=A0A0E0HLX8_ORYNI